jgi:hypothetical protein
MHRYVRKQNCETIMLDDEIMILNPTGLTITKISPVGGFCWSLLSAVHSIDSLSAAVHAHYEGTDPSVEQDISGFLDDLLECELIEAAD